jgi:hypothetical protein
MHTKCVARTFATEKQKPTCGRKYIEGDELRRSSILIVLGIILVFIGIIPVGLTLLQTKETITLDGGFYDTMNLALSQNQNVSAKHVKVILWSGILSQGASVDASVSVYLYGTEFEGRTYAQHWDASLYITDSFGFVLTENDTGGAIAGGPGALSIQMKVNMDDNYSVIYEHDAWAGYIPSWGAEKPNWPYRLSIEVMVNRPVDKYSLLVGAVLIICGCISLISAHAIRPTER